MDALLNNSIFHHLLLLSSPDGATSSEIEICEKISRCNPSPIAIHSQRLTRLFWKGEYRNYVYHNRGMYFIATWGKFRHLIIISSLEPGWELTLSSDTATAVGSLLLHPRSDRINIRSYLINKRKYLSYVLLCFIVESWFSYLPYPILIHFPLRWGSVKLVTFVKGLVNLFSNWKINEYGWRNMKLDNSNSLFRWMDSNVFLM